MRVRHRRHLRVPDREPGLLGQQIAASVRPLAQLGDRVIDRAARCGKPLLAPSRARPAHGLSVLATHAMMAETRLEARHVRRQ
jgi:hypothetical protein